jgi:hypothetical protein
LHILADGRGRVEPNLKKNIKKSWEKICKKRVHCIMFVPIDDCQDFQAGNPRKSRIRAGSEKNKIAPAATDFKGTVQRDGSGRN